MPLLEVETATGPSSRNEKRKDSTLQLSNVASLPSRSTPETTNGHYGSSPGRELWDPDLTWTKEEETMIRRKTDVRLLAVFCLMYLGIQMDRGNLSNALTDHFLQDLHLTTADYNNAMTIQRIAFLIAEFPVQCLVLRYGFRNIFPPMIMAWGTVSWAQAFMTGRTGFYVTRALIGGLEGGFVPGVIFFFTLFYTSKELSFRYAIIASVTDLSHAFAALLAAGVLKMRGIAGKPGWFWLFIIEGALTSIIGFFSYLYLPTSPTQTASPLHPKPWYTPHETSILLNRLLRDDPSKGQVTASTLPSPSDILAVWRDRTFYPFYLIGLIGFIPVMPVKQYLHLTLKRLGFSTFDSNMLSIPSSVLQIFTVLGLAKSSEYWDERTWHCVVGEAFVVPLLAGLVALPGGGMKGGMGQEGGARLGRSWERYTLSLLITGAPNFSPIVSSWISANAFDVKKRAIAVATYTTLALVGAVVSSQIYQPADEPYYYTGNKILLSIACLACAIFAFQRWYLRRLNKQKAHIWNAMDGNEQRAYQADQAAREKEGNRRIDFRFVY